MYFYLDFILVPHLRCVPKTTCNNLFLIIKIVRYDKLAQWGTGHSHRPQAAPEITPSCKNSQ